MSDQLRQYLRTAYQASDLSPTTRDHHAIWIDDYSSRDRHPRFCRICITVKADNKFDVLLHYAPITDAVERILKQRSNETKVTGAYKLVRIALSAGDIPFLRDLANAIEQIVGRGSVYHDRDWKWICPRTAKSLEKLAIHLEKFEELRKAGTLPTFQVKPPSVKVPPIRKGKTVQRKTPPAVQPEIDDDEENIFKICGVE